MPSRFLPAACLAVVCLAPPLYAQEKPSEPPAGSADATATDPIARIRAEGPEKSQVIETVTYLTDMIGPRLTNSPGMKRANEWTRDTMAGWGLENAHLESWGPFGRGWTLNRFSIQVIQLQCIPLIAFPKAWPPGTEGVLTAEVVFLDPKSEDDVASYNGKVKGKVVLWGDLRELKPWFEPMATRVSDAQLLEQANAPSPLDQPRSRPRRRPQGSPEDDRRFAIRRKVGELLRDEPPALIIEPSFTGDGGTLFVHSASVEPGVMSRTPRRSWNKETPAAVPQVVMTTEHFNRLARMIRKGETLTIAAELTATFHDDDPMGYNTIAEIPGSDRKEEVVMLGGHLDSWHAGTGATDNAAGCAVAMEAARLIKSLGLQPRRTIRVALWSGEEQGLLGSRAYVKEHFGELEQNTMAEAASEILGTPAGRGRLVKKPEYDTFSAYFNFDNGGGKIRGVHMEGNEAVRPIFRRWFAPFGDLGASTLSISRTGGTDHMAFDSIGLPGFQFIQDPLDYDARTHHSNMDVFERLPADDLKQASVIMAVMVYNAAMADEKLPRKPQP